MNKGPGGNQPFLWNGWFKSGETICSQEMIYRRTDPVTGQFVLVQKGIQRILEERELWPGNQLKLECLKPKCQSCQDAQNCKICIKGTRCEPCKLEKGHSRPDCNNGQPCDMCKDRKTRCSCMQKILCPSCEIKRAKKCEDCQNLPPKCTTNS